MGWRLRIESGGHVIKRAKTVLGFALKLVLLTTLLNPAPAVFAQSSATEPTGKEESLVESDEQSIAIRLDDLVVVGTRVRGVARQDLAVPVDVYEVQEMTSASGTADLAVALQQVAPSFNSQRNALGDGGLFHSALLRGMSPNHTLVLVNGKRRHSISFPRPLETALQGTTGVDLRAMHSAPSTVRNVFASAPGISHPMDAACRMPPGEAVAVTLDKGNVAQHGDLARRGHQGYPGYSPINARFGARDRSSHAVWADFRHDVTAAWNLETAVRWEQYQEAGDSVTGMVGSRLKLSPNASLRATASTGFRAPSLPELGFNTIVFEGTAQGGLTVTASLEDGAADRFFGLGSQNLQHETSRSLSAGMVLTPGSEVSISADVFWIEVSDRIVATSYTPDCNGDDAVGCGMLIAERQLPRITKIQFYDNVVDTRSTGLDVVTTHDRDFLSGELILIGALHFNETEITAGHDNIASHSQSYIEEGNPRQRHLLAADWADETSIFTWA